MLTIKNIIHFINTNIDEIATQSQENPTNQKAIEASKLLNIYARLLAILNDSNNGMNKEKIKEAIEFIEHVPIKQVFGSPIPFSKILQEKATKLLSTDKNFDIVFTKEEALKKSYHEILGRIHVSLMSLLENTWSYSYPLGSEGQIMNDSIEQWQNSLMEISKEPKKALRDFNRSINIGDRVGSTIEESENLINQLVDRANSYPEEDKPLLKIWLVANGGQECHQLSDILLEGGHFTDKQKDDWYAPGISKKLENRWVVENGKIYFYFDKVLFSLLHNGALVLKNNNNLINIKHTTPIQKYNDGTIEITEGRIIQEFIDNKEKANPIMRIQGKIELAMIKTSKEHKVCPKVIILNVESYSEYLKSPARLINPTKSIKGFS